MRQSTRSTVDTGNRLLDALARDCPLLLEKATPVDLPVGTPIYVAGRRISHVYFPTRGVVSTLVTLRDGDRGEATTIGNEGMVGLAVWLGLPVSLEDVAQHLPGELLRVSARDFCHAIDDSLRARRILKRFAAFRMHCADQTAVCNVHHGVEQRTCRWLLTVMDRAQSLNLQITQALLAEMVGVRRQSVSEVASRLQRTRVIRNTPRLITILDPERLQALACECYATLRHLYQQVVAPAF